MKFFEKVYTAVKNIPCGKVASYGQIAAICGNARMARQVGWALHVNPNPKKIPCHRVVSKEGKVARSFAFGGEEAQTKLLTMEGVKFDKNGCVKQDFFICEK